MRHIQPAKTVYIFHDGFVDLARVISGVFERCGEVISGSASGIADAWSDICSEISEVSIFEFDFKGFFTAIPPFFKLSFYIARLIFCAVITPVICLIITIFQTNILLALFLTASIFFGIIILLDRIFCVVNSILSHCPYCQNKFILPVYVCSCGNEHDRLRPGIYGILKRTCNCGKKLPTTFLNGRHKLDAKCPSCNNNIKDGGLHSSWCIPVVGGSSSGKTCYINMTMMSLDKNSLPKYGLQFKHEMNGLDEYEENTARLSHGNLPEQTQELRLRYYQFTLTPKKATKQQIALCDVAGEIFDISKSGTAINDQTGFRFVNAFMLIIDPLSIPQYRDEVSKVTNLNGYRGGVQRIDEMLDTFVRTLQNMFSIDAKTMIKTDVAVIFTKADIPGLDEKIGESAVLKTAPSLKQEGRYKTQNKLCEQFLCDYDEQNFLNNLKSRFHSIQFFTCSALGHVENGQPFVASNVEEPFFWLIRKRSKVIDNAVKRGGKK